MTMPSTELDLRVGTVQRPATCYTNAKGEVVELPCADVPARYVHTDERMAYALSAEHPHSLRRKHGMLADGLMHRGGLTTLDMLYVANERGRNHPAYKGTPETRFMPAAGDRLLLGQLSQDARLGMFTGQRSMPGCDMTKYKCKLPDRVEGEAPPDASDYELVATDESVNECYIDAGAELAEFPTFDLYITEPKCGCTYKLADSAGMADSGMFMFAEPAAWLGIPSSQVPHSAAWEIWADLKGPVLPNSFLRIQGYQIVK